MPQQRDPQQKTTSAVAEIAAGGHISSGAPNNINEGAPATAKTLATAVPTTGKTGMQGRHKNQEW